MSRRRAPPVGPVACRAWPRSAPVWPGVRPRAGNWPCFSGSATSMLPGGEPAARSDLRPGQQLARAPARTCATMPDDLRPLRRWDRRQVRICGDAGHRQVRVLDRGPPTGTSRATASTWVCRVSIWPPANASSPPSSTTSTLMIRPRRLVRRRAAADRTGCCWTGGNSGGAAGAAAEQPVRIRPERRPCPIRVPGQRVTTDSTSATANVAVAVVVFAVNVPAVLVDPVHVSCHVIV